MDVPEVPRKASQDALVRILTRDSVSEYLGKVTIAPITTTVGEVPSEVFLSTVDGVPKDCAVNSIYRRFLTYPRRYIATLKGNDHAYLKKQGL